MEMHVASIEQNAPDILLVDDDAAVRRSILMLLKARGFQVKSYGLGSALVSDPAAHCAHLLITDWHMPDMDGFEVLAALRAMGWNGSALMLTGYYDPILAATAAQRGFICTLAKPIQDHRLIAVVGHLLRPDRPPDGGQRQ